MSDVVYQITHGIKQALYEQKKGMNLLDAIVKVAQDNKLNADKTRRVTEGVNTLNMLELLKSGNDRTVVFPVADSREVVRLLIGHEKAAQAYREPPVFEYLIDDVNQFVPHQDRIVIKQAHAILDAAECVSPYTKDSAMLVEQANLAIRKLEKQAEDHRVEAWIYKDQIMRGMVKLAEHLQGLYTPTFVQFEKEADYLYGKAADDMLYILSRVVPTSLHGEQAHTKQAALIDDRTPAHQMFQKILKAEKGFALHMAKAAQYGQEADDWKEDLNDIHRRIFLDNGLYKMAAGGGARGRRRKAKNKHTASTTPPRFQGQNPLLPVPPTLPKAPRTLEEQERRNRRAEVLKGRRREKQQKQTEKELQQKRKNEITKAKNEAEYRKFQRQEAERPQMEMERRRKQEMQRAKAEGEYALFRKNEKEKRLIDREQQQQEEMQHAQRAEEYKEWKKTHPGGLLDALNPVQYARSVTGLPGKYEAVDKFLKMLLPEEAPSKTEPSYYDRLRDTLKLQSTIQHVIDSDPVLRERNAEDLLPVIQTIAQTSPEIARHPIVLASVLREASSGANETLDPLTVKQLAETEAAIHKARLAKTQREQENYGYGRQSENNKSSQL